MDPIPVDLLGRYEYTLGSSNKQWTCRSLDEGVYQVSWGPIGAPDIPSRRQVVDRAKAMARIREKLREGYEHSRSHQAALVALERLTLESLFEKGSTTLRRRSRPQPVDTLVETLVQGAVSPAVEALPAPRLGRRRL